MGKIICVVVFIALMLRCSCMAVRNEMNGGDDGKEETMATAYEPLNYDNVKAIWISQYDLESVYTDGGAQRERSDFTNRINEMLDNVVSMGVNTVIVQVRPFADSMYPSEYYPVSYFVTGEYGKSADYDPFEIILEAAHSRELSVHAWINPLRGMTETDIRKIPDSYKIREWYDKGKYVSVVLGRVYLDPYYPEVRELIANGAREIVRLYNVDGVHMDDYFYPTTDESFDALAYAEYEGDEDLAQFRRNNVNTLIRDIYSAVKSEKSDVPFGISPAGSMRYNYYKLYADVYEWCGNEGYIDYICPQIYFGFEHETCDFVKLCHQFSDMIKCDSIKLIIGMTLGKAVSGTDPNAGSGKDEWRDNKDIMLRELEYTMKLEKCIGVSYFCYQYFYDPVTGAPNPAAKTEIDALLPRLRSAKW